MIRLVPFFSVLLTASALQAAAPKLDWLYPAGVGRGTTTTITVSDSAAWPVQVWVDQPQHITVEAAKEKGKLTITTTADATPGVRWLRLHNAEGASSLRPLIIGSLPEVEEAEPNNTVAKAQKMAHPITVNGRLDKSGDVDGFRVSLKQGQTFIAALTANGILASPMDGVLQLCDGEGNVLTQNDDEVGLDSRIVYKVERDGEYLVRVFAFPAAPNSTINFAGGADYIYRLTLTTGPFADHALPMAVPRGETAQVVSVAGWNLPDALRSLPVTSDARSEFVTLHHEALANTISLPRSDHACLVADASGREAKAQAIDVPCVITGRLSEASHVSAFRFEASKGTRLRITADAHSLGFPLDAVLIIRDAAGKVLSETDDSAKARDPSLIFAPPADGEYDIVLKDLHDRGGLRFVYRLTIEPVTPDFALTLAADSFVAAAGKPLEIAVTIDRRDGFADEIEIKLEGLPEGVTVASVVSKPKDATAKSVKLIIPAGAATWAGPVRIVAQSKDLQRYATFTAVGNARHDTAWLTIPAKK